ncbi:hypothetical protein C8R43DRAFT_968598 [Mycena crocata]|nr:hypothetical protein C8R43DRAFT_968598 [Mycena crocata]
MEYVPPTRHINALEPPNLLSRLKDLLSSNEVPLSQDIPSIRRIITDNEARLDALNNQIGDLRRATEQLVMERDTIAEEVRMHTAVLSPLRRLPPELICKIFTSTLPCTRQIQGDTVPCAPWYLGHVCRSWRYAAHGYSPLWSAIHVSPEELVLDALSATDNQLILSANALLEIKVNFGFRRIDLDGEPAFDLLLPHSNRWRSFHLAAPQSLLPLLQSTNNRLFQLQQLRLFTGDYDSSSQTYPDIFSNTPNLREAFLADPKYRGQSPLVHLPWSQLTHYRGVYDTDRQLEILAAAPNLIECGIRIDGRGEGDEDEMITLLHLRRFYTDGSYILAHLKAPSLQKLYSEGPTGHLLAFVLRSSCQLTHLVLTGEVLSHTLRLIIPVLKNLPSLEFLLLEEPRSDPSETELVRLFDAMKLSGQPADLCPNLASFIFAVEEDYSDIVASSFVAMLQSRLHASPPQVPLSDVRLFPFSGAAKFTKALTDGTLACEGLDFVILSEPDWEALTMQDRP